MSRLRRQRAARLRHPHLRVAEYRHTGELAEDPDSYKAMHYHEKRGEWEQAAKAAEGVSEFAKQKFIQKAEQE